MNKYVKDYFMRGLMFGGFGPIVAGIVLCILQLTKVNVSLSGTECLIAIISTYILAFVQAGSSVFNQVEGWSIAKSMGLHFLSLYVAYVTCYLMNRWIPFAWEVIAIFTIIFVAAYLVIWLTVYFIVRTTSRKLNSSIKNQKA